MSIHRNMPCQLCGRAFNRHGPLTWRCPIPGYDQKWNSDGLRFVPGASGDFDPEDGSYPPDFEDEWV